MTGERRSRSTEAFFGRRRGKTLRPLPTVALAKGLDTYGLDISRPAQMELSELFNAGVSRIRLEIGFGGGEHLHHAASADPSTGFLGVEPFVNGMAKAMQLLSVRPLPNIRVYDDDATRLLDWLPDSSLAGIDLFYPDPWPKKKHWKRRFVSPANLGRFTRVMKTGALFRFASDIDNYVNWTLLHVRSSRAFDWLASEADDWHRPFEDWPGTRYEAKAIREGRRPAYLTFRRR